MRIISPSILSADFANLGQQVKLASDAGAKYIHIDIMDGHFVPNLTMGPCVVESIRKYTDAVFDVHLMIENPEKYIESFVKSGADLITVHIETTDDMPALIKLIRSYGVKVGITLNPPTPVEAVLPYIDDADMVLVMTVNPGFGGQSLIEDCLDKIRTIRKLYPDKDIEIDGGVKMSNLKQVVDAGANIIVAGSAVFGADNPADVIKDMINLK